MCYWGGPCKKCGTVTIRYNLHSVYVIVIQIPNMKNKKEVYMSIPDIPPIPGGPAGFGA